MMINNDSKAQNTSIYSNVSSSREDSISMDRNSGSGGSNHLSTNQTEIYNNSIRPNYQTLNKAVGLVTNSIVVSSY